MSKEKLKRVLEDPRAFSNAEELNCKMKELIKKGAPISSMLRLKEEYKPSAFWCKSNIIIAIMAGVSMGLAIIGGSVGLLLYTITILIVLAIIDWRDRYKEMVADMQLLDAMIIDHCEHCGYLWLDESDWEEYCKNNDMDLETLERNVKLENESKENKVE